MSLMSLKSRGSDTGTMVRNLSAKASKHQGLQTNCATAMAKQKEKWYEIHRNTSKYIEPFSLATRKQHLPLQSWLCELLQPQHFHVSKSVAIRQYQKHSKTTFRIQSNTSLYTYVVYNMIFYDKNGLLKAEVRDSIGHSVFVILPFLCLILPLIHRLVS